MTDNIPIAFNAYTTPLEPGINLIEASAGTGKTYSIATLVLRFVVENNLPIEQLLVVTYTRAATKELKDRIRLRLTDARKALLGDADDEGLRDWAASIADKDQAQQRIVMALADIDRAHIFTIHSFCQRMLAQFALESGQLFDSELVDSVDSIKMHISEDYWRQQTYERNQTQVSLLRQCASTPSTLLSQITGIRTGSRIVPNDLDLDQALASADEAISTLPRTLQNNVLKPLAEAFEAHLKKFNKAFKESFQHRFQNINLWLEQGGALPLDDLLYFSTESMLVNLVIRGSGGLTAADKRAEFLQEIEYDGSSLDALDKQIRKIRIAFPLGLYQQIQQQLEKRLLEDNILSFDDLISRLSHALEDEKGQRLTAVLRERFKVALIDEFQDTDKQQWHIFSTLFSPDSKAQSAPYLYLIGDPKQAIYKFRGADIYSYLGAQEEATCHFNLGTNFRSQQNLIAATNALFGVEDKPFLIDKIEYYPVNAARKDKYLQQGEHHLDKMVLWELAAKSDGKYWSSGIAATQIQRHVVNEIVRLLNAGDEISLKNGDLPTPLLSGDMAILVRSHSTAAEYQQLLQEHGVPAVLNSKQSVFQSEEALYLYHLLTAISRPTNTALVKYALTLPWFGLSGQDLVALQHADDGFDQWQMDFQRYHELWYEQGLIAMIQQLMQEKQVVSHLSKYASVERVLTNLNHILELVQQQAQEQRLGQSKTVDWLQFCIQEKSSTEGQELRLESDDAAVKIVTIHSSKGLEYPIVFCPDLWKSPTQWNKSMAVCYEENETITDMGSENLEKHLEMALAEQRAEDLRLMYVAVTRAKNRCYLLWADVRTKNVENSSSVAYLLRQQQGETWEERMHALMSQEPEAFEYEKLEVDVEMPDSFSMEKQHKDLQVLQLGRELVSDWSMSSYSSLAYYSIHEDMHENEPSELPRDKSEEPEIAVMQTAEIDNEEEIIELPKGAHTGNVVHELLENITFKELSKGGVPTDQYIEEQEKLCSTYGLDIGDKEKEVLIQLLADTVNTPLSADDENFCLAALEERQCLKEMPFYFATEKLDTLAINQVLKDSPAYQMMNEKKMRGLLTGFIDLICEYNGRYYVMDYKTNALPQYDSETMTKAMREHNYGLQYWLYSLVLHEYLKQRIPDYDFATHFGGVRYLFVRGMTPEGNMLGVFEDMPALDTLNALSTAFQGVRV